MTSGDAGEKPAHTVDKFLGGKVTLVQPARGHRAGLDAALLQAIVPAGSTGHAVDLGTGVGTIALSLAARTALTITGVERDPALIAYGRAALALPENAGFAGRVSFIEADVAALSERDAGTLPPRCADWVLMNPPWDKRGDVRESPDQSRRAAHVAGVGLLSAWMGVAVALLKPRATIGLIHRASALPEILEALAERFGDVRVLPAHPTEKAAAKRILVRATLGSRDGFQLLPALVLHEADGGWTRRADAILRGDAELQF